jgi:predicted phosphate transport protein (TIGR00153 family)
LPRLSQVLSPRGGEFFDLFEEAGGNIVRAADLLDQMVRDYPAQRELAREILIAEQEGDRITHDLIHALNNTFVTPIDREDIIALASALDDIVDYTEEVADMLGLYKIERVNEAAKKMAAILNQASRQVAEAVQRLRTFSGMSHYTVELNRLENEGDRAAREAVAALFDDVGLEARDIIRWKDIYEHLEEAIDATEQVAHILEGISIKNA